MYKRWRWRRVAQDDSGAAVVEMVFAIPLVLLIGLGVIELANYLFSYQLVQNGVRNAARFGASLPFPQDSAEQATQDAWIRNIAVTGQPTGGNSRLSTWNTTHVNLTRSTVANPPLSGGLRTYRNEGDVVLLTVSAQVPYGSVGFLGFLGVNALTLDASQQERVSGAR